MAFAFQRAYPPAQPAAVPAYWFVFQNGNLLVQEREGGIGLVQRAPDDLAELPLESPVYLGTLDDVPCMAAEISAETAVPAGMKVVGLRALYGQFSEAAYGTAGYATQIVLWQRTSRFCPVCGSTTEQVPNDWGKRCTNCGYTRYPPVYPAVLALIHDGDRVLLTHKPGWAAMYSIVAGFVEPGESFEECVQREVLEEVGVEVTDVVYDGSQPWPFPHQVMVGFTARYVGGDITRDETELDDARWFDVHDLPPLPAPLSLSRQLLDRWIASRQRAA